MAGLHDSILTHMCTPITVQVLLNVCFTSCYCRMIVALMKHFKFAQQTFNSLWQDYLNIKHKYYNMWVMEALTMTCVSLNMTRGSYKFTRPLLQLYPHTRSYIYTIYSQQFLQWQSCQKIIHTVTLETPETRGPRLTCENEFSFEVAFCALENCVVDAMALLVYWCFNIR